MSTFGPVEVIQWFNKATKPWLLLTRSYPTVTYDRGEMREGDGLGDFKAVVHANPVFGVPLVLTNTNGTRTYTTRYSAENYVRNQVDDWISWSSHGPSAVVATCSIYQRANPGNAFVFRCWVYPGIWDAEGAPRYIGGTFRCEVDGRMRITRCSGSGCEFARIMNTRAMFQSVIDQGLIVYGGISEAGAKFLTEFVVHAWDDFNHAWELYGDYTLRTDGDSRTINNYVEKSFDLTGGFMFDEWYNIPVYHKPGTYLPSLTNYWLDVARNRAFVDACDNMPALSDNSISNAQSALEFILSVVRREPPKLPSNLADAWLAYRYEYSTTKMDVKEAWEFINRCYDLGSMFTNGRTHGIYRFVMNGVDVELRVTFDVKPRAKSRLRDFTTLWRDASQLGLAPDLYYLWDSTPFSFIVDWFLPVGDVLSAIDASNVYHKENYEFGPLCYTLNYTREVEGFPIRYFSRWTEASPPIIHPFYWLENRDGPSLRQVVYRAADAISLIIGGL